MIGLYAFLFWFRGTETVGSVLHRLHQLHTHQGRNKLPLARHRHEHKAHTYCQQPSLCRSLWSLASQSWDTQTTVRSRHPGCPLIFQTTSRSSVAPGLRLGFSLTAPAENRSLTNLLAAHPLVKVQLNGDPAGINDLARTLAEGTGARVLEVQGGIILLARGGWHILLGVD